MGGVVGVVGVASDRDAFDQLRDFVRAREMEALAQAVGTVVVLRRGVHDGFGSAVLTLVRFCFQWHVLIDDVHCMFIETLIRQWRILSEPQVDQTLFLRAEYLNASRRGQ